MNDQDQVAQPTSMWGTIFGTITTIFRATNKAAMSVENLVEWTNEETALIRDESRLERAHRIAKLKAIHAADAVPA